MTDTNANGLGRELGDLTFEQALERLDSTVQALESGGLSLEEATRLYEEGIGLARMCSEALASAELRITRIRTAHGEQMRFLAEDLCWLRGVSLLKACRQGYSHRERPSSNAGRPHHSSLGLRARDPQSHGRPTARIQPRHRIALRGATAPRQRQSHSASGGYHPYREPANRVR